MNTDPIARAIFGRTKAEALAASECIRCGAPIVLADLSDVDRREFAITAMCGACFDAVTEDCE